MANGMKGSRVSKDVKFFSEAMLFCFVLFYAGRELQQEQIGLKRFGQ